MTWNWKETKRRNTHTLQLIEQLHARRSVAPALGFSLSISSSYRPAADLSCHQSRSPPSLHARGGRDRAGHQLAQIDMPGRLGRGQRLCGAHGLSEPRPRRRRCLIRFRWVELQGGQSRPRARPRRSVAPLGRSAARLVPPGRPIWRTSSLGPKHEHDDAAARRHVSSIGRSAE
jgi:hypothetical protein